MTVDDDIHLPSPALIVLVGPSGSGKTTWANARFPAGTVVSADALRALVGDGDRDVRASADAFEVLEAIVAKRAARRLTTVVDSLGNDAERRRAWRALATRHRLASVAVVFRTPPAVCRARNRARRDPVPTQVLDRQLRHQSSVTEAVAGEGFDRVVHIDARADTGRGEDAGGRAAPRARPGTPSSAAPSAAPAAAPVAPPPNPPEGRLRIGLQIPSLAWAAPPSAIGERLRAVARSAERAGVSSLWLMDHFRQIPMFGPPWHDMLDSWTALAHLAAATERMSLGTLVSGVTYRNIGHLAKIVATLDVLSGGRAVCGLGAAWYADEHHAYGYRFPPLAERFAMLEDALQALPMLWGAGQPPYVGATLSLADTMCYPRPLQAKVPIIVGGNGERRTLALAARYADGCNIIGHDEEFVRRKIAVLHDHAHRSGRDPAELRVTQLSTVLVGRDRDDVARLVERHRPPRRGPDRWARLVHAATLTEHGDHFRRLADAGVHDAIVSLPDLGDADALDRLGELIALVNER